MHLVDVGFFALGLGCEGANLLFGLNGDLLGVRFEKKYVPLLSGGVATT
jgi:hypothetical protein